MSEAYPKVRILTGGGTSSGTGASAATTPTIYNISATTAGTEYSQALSSNTKRLLIRVRGIANARFAFVATETATNYVSIPKGATYAEDNLDLSSVTLYVQTDQNNQVVEVLEWS